MSAVRRAVRASAGTQWLPLPSSPAMRGRRLVTPALGAGEGGWAVICPIGARARAPFPGAEAGFREAPLRAAAAGRLCKAGRGKGAGGRL